MEQILKELMSETKYQLFHYPQTTKKQDIKYLIKRVLRPTHTPKRDFFSWPQALLAQSLETAGELETLKKYLDLWIEKGLPIHNIDNVMNGYSLLYVFEETKEEKYKQEADKLYEYLIQYTKDMNGNIPYRKGTPYHIYVDGVGMIAPFLCRYGKVFGKEEAISLGIKQIQDFLKYGMDENTGFPYHGYDIKTEVKHGIIGWGRALGWLMLAMADSIEYMHKGKEQQEMIDAFRKLLETSLQYFRTDGYFSWQLPAMEGPKDTSATAMIGYALIKGKEYLAYEDSRGQDLLIHDGKTGLSMDETLEKIEAALLSSCKSGKIYDCSGECHGFSQYPQVYGAYPWSLGPGMRFLIMYNQK